MDNKYDEQFIIMQAAIETNNQEMKADMKSNKQDSDEKMMQFTETLKFLTSFMMDQAKNSKSSPTQKGTSTPPDPTTVVPDNMRVPPLEGGHSTKIFGMWNLKHEISSPKFYEILIKTELKGDTALDFKNFYNHIKMCLNEVNRIQEDLLPSYQPIKRKSKFEEYFIPYCYHLSYYWYVQIYTSLGHSRLVAMTNETCVKYFMVPQ